MYDALTVSEVNELPLLEYMRTCRVVVHNINNILAAYRLGKTDNWHHIFTDGTTRMQIKF